MIKLPSLTQIGERSKMTFLRFPLATVSAFIGTIIAIYAIEHNIDDNWLWRTLFIASLSTVFFAALALACETVDKTKRSGVMILGVLLMGTYYYFLPEDPDTAGSKFWMRHVFLCLGSVVALTWVPYWKSRAENPLIWEWNRKLIMNIVVTGFFSGVLFGGIAAAFFAIDSLFGVEFDHKIYFQTWVAIIGAFAPLFFLAHLPEQPQKLKLPKPIPAFMNVFTKYILTPLAVGYFVILYAYTFKVLITWEWPKNVLGWLVICFSAVAIFTYFLWTPYWKEKIEKYRRLFWWGLIPQIVMLFIAIGWRIQAYSWTENRYFVVILGCWLLGISFYFLISKKATFKSAFVVLTGIIFMSQLGPISGYAMGERAQMARLKEILHQAKILQNGEILPTKIKLDRETRYEISDIVDYLISRHGHETVRPIFPKIMKKLEKEKTVYRYGLARDITKELGFDFINDWERKQRSESTHFNFSIQGNAPRNIEGYTWHVMPGRYNNKDITLNGETFNFEIKPETFKIEIHKNGNLWESIDVKPFIDKLVNERIVDENRELNPEKLTYEYESENLKSKIFFINIWGEKGKVNSFDVQMYVNLK